MRWKPPTVRLALAVLLLTSVPPSVAHAQFYHVTLGVAGGLTVPTGNSTTPIQTGFNGQAYLLIRLLPFLPVLRFNLGYSHYSFKDALDSAVGSGYNGKSRQVLSGLGELSLPLFKIGPVRPYVLAGLGAFDVSTNADSATVGKTQRSFNFGIDGGGGLSLALGRFSAFAEGRVQNVYTKSAGFIKSAKQIQAVPVSFGLAVGLF